MDPQLVQSQTPSPDCSVSVWKELVAGSTSQQPQWQYKKVWSSTHPQTNAAWLSWAHHEHLILTLLAGRGAEHVVQVSGLQVSTSKVELVTLDAGGDFEREWLTPASQFQLETLWASEDDALKWARACLVALKSVHKLGLVHGDLKSDNICVSPSQEVSSRGKRIDLGSIRLIDFAYSLYREAPLQFVLPTDPDKLSYLPNFFKVALKQAQSKNQVHRLNAVTCAAVDLFSLFCLLEQTVSPRMASSWKDWSSFLDMCRTQGELRPQSTLWPWNRRFETPTQSLLDHLEAILTKRHIPIEEWSWAQTSLASVVAPTPLINTLPDERMMTPLVRGQSHPVSTLMPRYVVFLSYALLLAILGVIDTAYTKHNLVVSDLGYYFSIVAIPLFIWLTAVTFKWMVQQQKPEITTWRTAAFGLFAIELYFGFTLPVDQELFLQIVLSLVLLMCLLPSVHHRLMSKVV